MLAALSEIIWAMNLIDAVSSLELGCTELAIRVMSLESSWSRAFCVNEIDLQIVRMISLDGCFGYICCCILILGFRTKIIPVETDDLHDGQWEAAHDAALAANTDDSNIVEDP